MWDLFTRKGSDRHVPDVLVPDRFALLGRDTPDLEGLFDLGDLVPQPDQVPDLLGRIGQLGDRFDLIGDGGKGGVGVGGH